MFPRDGRGAVVGRFVLRAVAVHCALASGPDLLAEHAPHSGSGASTSSGTGRLAVVWTDLSSGDGVLGVLGGTAPWGFESPLLSIGPDTIVRYAGGRLYVVSRAASSVSVVCRDTWAVLNTHTLGAEANPQDIAIVSPTRAFVTRRAARQLLRLDPTTGATEEVVDLGVFADPESTLDVRMMAVHEGRLFVQFCRIDPGPTLPAGYLAVVDLATEQLVDVDAVAPGVQAIALQGMAPRFKMQIVPEVRQLFVSATGDFFDNGGLEMIDLDALQSAGLAVREADGEVGADLGAFVVVTPERGYLTCSTDLLLSSHLLPFTVAGGVTPGPQLHEALGYFVPTLVHDPATEVFFFPEGGFHGDGVHVFDAFTGVQLTTEMIATTGPPTDLELLCDFDCDGDRRADLTDFRVFAGCLDGPGSDLELGCLCCDRDSSGSVDLLDFAALQRLFGGGL